MKRQVLYLDKLFFQVLRLYWKSFQHARTQEILWPQALPKESIMERAPSKQQVINLRQKQR